MNRDAWLGMWAQLGWCVMMRAMVQGLERHAQFLYDRVQSLQAQLDNLRVDIARANKLERKRGQVDRQGQEQNQVL